MRAGKTQHGRLRFLISCLVLSSFLTVMSGGQEFTLDPANNEKNIGDFPRHSLEKGSKLPFIATDGQIFLTPDPTDGTPRPSTQNKVGRVSYIKSIQFKDDHKQFLSFDTSFKFNITTATKYNESGDGIAFVMTTDAPIPPNSTGRFLGLMPESPNARYHRFLAVEFDTFQNLEAEIADPSASHIGININNLSSVAYLDTASESHPLYLYHNSTFTAWVSYNASSHLIQVWATTSSHAQRPKDPAVTCRRNLSQLFENDTSIHVGIVAASGNNSQATILYTWNFTVGQNPAKNPPMNKWYIVIPIVLGALGLMAAATYITLQQRRLVKGQRQLVNRWQGDKATIEKAFLLGSLHGYKYTELERATQMFNDAQVIGKGGFSTVYKGVFADGSQVAVKRMAGDGLVKMEAEVIAREVQIIRRIRHRHLLQLKGWCYDKGEALLVYDYMPRGSLDSYLYGKQRRLGEIMLDSETRFKIIVGVAGALEYLHEDLPGSDRVLHRDVKAANVLLTDTMEPMLADFGLSRLIASDDQVVTITLAGTPGYVAPEVMATGKVDDKVDVYSFGVLALEVACGRQALDPRNSQYSRLLDWVWLSHRRTSILDALDPHLAGAISSAISSCSQGFSPTNERPEPTAVDEMVQKWRCVLHLGLLCCQAYPDARPRMREVHQALKECRVLAPPHSWVLYPSPGHHASPDTGGAAASESSVSLSFFSC